MDEATGALDALRDLTRGIFPTMLTRTGLGPALSTYFGRLGRPDALRLADGVAGRRFSDRTEAAAYFCCTAAVPDLTGTARVSLTVVDDELVIEIAGAAQTDTDLAAMVDRVEALGGSLQQPDDRGPRRRACWWSGFPSAPTCRHRSSGARHDLAYAARLGPGGSQPAR